MNSVDPVELLSNAPHDPRDPDPWVAMFLDSSLPMNPRAKASLLVDQRSRSRQFLLPLIRIFSRLSVILLQVLKTVVPNRFTSSKLLHRLLSWGMRTWVSPEANYLILRHFHVGSELLGFIARNTPELNVPVNPLLPTNMEHVKDEIFLKHDLNLYNFVIRLNRALRDQERTLAPPARLDFSGISDAFPLEPMPHRWTNFLDLQSAIELFTPLYQLFLTDRDFWRASNSLQLDETIAIYVATLLQAPGLVALVNNRHPLVPLATMEAGFRLVLHGLSAENLHGFLVECKHGRMPQLARVVSAGLQVTKPSGSQAA
ncbi:hypothetical protein POL68_26495 [Stigmatella sp. ncwal1]|uniref:Uncharacterized protein n=1 Tax=Stigmatella ashevillensis TaxID=2995309 RepID=A0ABT5DEG9_9BACT|nr:hypothetical protein [Stigmatella ashevillena]MDC0712046.1 hypothetical protein [Stigmatella ashevillena]